MCLCVYVCVCLCLFVCMYRAERVCMLVCVNARAYVCVRCVYTLDNTIATDCILLAAFYWL